ncbi:MAG: pitrilysin family protein [Saprospiraceae bacterium]|nr:pitrilysin family protein [Saprospiraceae bacterium]
MLNRKIAPPILESVRLDLPQAEYLTLDNGIPVYVLDFPDQEIVKIELVYRAGRPQEGKRMVARACARLLREGTTQRTGAEIAEFFDFYGASLNTPNNLDTTNIVLFSLKKYAAQVIPVMAEVLLQPAFPASELETFKRTSIQELLVDLEKVEILAYRKITELIFGEHHPYGYNSTPDDYLALNRSDLVAFYEQWYTPKNAVIIASGRIDTEIIQLLNAGIGQDRRVGKQPDFPFKAPSILPEKITIPMASSLQTAIKIGRNTFNRHHPHAHGFFVLNTILGGYFGSRLMTNIREKRGYTYNIYSSSDHYLNDGCFYIATEVNRDKAAATIKQIYAELKLLREKPVDEQELHMVRNYLLGMILNGLDGPLNTSDVVRGLIIENQTKADFDHMVESIRNITPEILQELAQEYLKPEDLWLVTAGA